MDITRDSALYMILNLLPFCLPVEYLFSFDLYEEKNVNEGKQVNLNYGSLADKKSGMILSNHDE